MRMPRAVVALCVVAALSLAAGTAQAADQHVFDPLLSLRGDCKADKIDTVIDPGCPFSIPPEGPHPFSKPLAAGVDSHGYTYVTTYGSEENGEAGQVDVFDPEGKFATEVGTKELFETFGEEFGGASVTYFSSPAIDSQGYLYLFLARGGGQVLPHSHEVVRYTPSSYPPSATTTYGSPTLIDSDAVGVAIIAINLANDHVLIDKGTSVSEYDSAANGNSLLRAGIGSGSGLTNSTEVAVGPNGDIFASGVKPGLDPIPTSAEPYVSQVYVFDGVSGELKEVIDGSDSDNCGMVNGEEKCGFNAPVGQLGVAVEREGGDVFVNDANGGGPVYQFRLGVGEKYHYLAESKFKSDYANINAPIALDNGALSPNRGYLYLSAQPSGVGHLIAFAPEEKNPSEIRGSGTSGIAETEATLEAEVNPHAAETFYSFQYTTEADWAANGYANGAQAPTLPKDAGSGGEFVSVSTPIEGLLAGTVYRFRLLATSNCDPKDPVKICTTEGENARFSTYPAQFPSSGCPNQSFRTGASSSLPDCRAYELVTPSDTNGSAPAGAFGLLDTPPATSDGNSVAFLLAGGQLPGSGTGAFAGDGYRAQRDGRSGWQTESAGPSGAQSQGPLPDGGSPDHSRWLWRTGGNDEGSLALAQLTTYIREPDGSFVLVGTGTLPAEPDTDGNPNGFQDDLHARAWKIAPGTGRSIFTAKVALAEGASPSGTLSVYGRIPGGQPQILSLKPDGTPFGAGEDAVFQGATPDGTVVAFKVGAALYAGLGNAQTLAVDSAATLFAGLSHDGDRLFYLSPKETPKGDPTRGEIFYCDLAKGPCVGPEAHPSTPIGSGEKATFVNISDDGSHVYFASPEQLDGAQGQPGKDNLYAWDGESIRFIATLDHLDLTGMDLSASGGATAAAGLGLWVGFAVFPEQGPSRGPAIDPSRSTPDGSMLVFESHADLTGSESGGHSQIYRYNTADGSLRCLSCDPTLATPSADSRLQHMSFEPGSSSFANALVHIANISADGQMVFFESAEALVPSDANGVQDVYEWRAGGVSGCATDDGCLALISSGHSQVDSTLYAMSSDGHDVFIQTADTLLPRDKNETPSVYDARIGGGFPEGESTPCQDADTCKGPSSPPPVLPSGSSSPSPGEGSTRSTRPCPKGKRKVRRGGRVRCVAEQKRTHRKHRQHNRGLGR